MPSSIIQKPDGGKIIKTNCFECHAKCGVLAHVDSKGTLVKVEGNPEDPRNQGRMCAKGRSAVQILNHPDRINYPMKRVGNRGEGKWERISWDEAMDTLVSKIEMYKKEFGPESIVFGQGTGRGTVQWNQRMGNTIGVNHWLSPSHICLMPIVTVSFQMFGCMPIWDGCDLDRSECQVFWGANLAWTEATFAAGEINRGRERAAKLIVVDPNFEHPLAAKADHFVPVRPGSDSAMAMSWINIIIEEDLFDHDFVKKWTTAPLLIDAKTLDPISEADIKPGGSPERLMVWDRATNGPRGIDEQNIDQELDGYFEITGISGKKIKAKTAWQELRERAAKMPPERAAQLCWTEAGKIREAARMYATSKPAAITYFQGIEEHTNAKHTIQAINTLIAITGNLDRLGGNLWAPFYNEMLGPRLTGDFTELHWKKKLGDIKFFPFSHAPAAWDAMITGKPYPIKAFITVQGNPISWSENSNKVVQALKAVDFLVVMDYFMSPTAKLADMVLPSAHWTERDYIADEMILRWFFAQQRAVDPLFERKSDATFFRELGRRLDPKMWPWKTDEEMFDFQLEPTGVTWKELKDRWILEYAPLQEKTYEKEGFPTTTKKAEIYTVVFQRAGTDPLPDYEEPAESPYSRPEVAKKYPFVLVTGRRYPQYFHSAFRGIPYLRELAPEPRVMINMETAKKLDIKENDEVWIESPQGKIKMKAQLTMGLHQRVVSLPHGWWQGCPELGLPDYPDNIANANVLISDQHYDKDIGTPGSRSSLCRVYKA